MSSLWGCKEYFRAELISCCEEITGQSFPRTCSYGSGMVSQQGYLSGETEARRRRHMPETPPGCEAQPGSRDWNFPQGLVKSCCLKRAGGENKRPASLGHWECWCALGSSAVPADPITHGCWTLRAWLWSQPIPLNPSAARRGGSQQETAWQLRSMQALPACATTFLLFVMFTHIPERPE